MAPGGDQAADGGEIERGVVPWADVLENVSNADAERIKVLRLAILRRLVELPLVVEEFARWEPT